MSVIELPDLGPRFAPLERLGGGAMSETWLAEDGQTGKKVVVKRPVAGLSQSAGRAAIAREARALGQLDHPFIPAVAASFEYQGTPVLAVEWIDGEALTALRGRPAEELVPVLIGIAEGLVHAHARGVIHRDVKPTNVILDSSGKPHLIDFGIAADSQDGDRWPVGGGTTGYACPQQLAGERPDPRDDVYAFGALAADLLSGSPPTGSEPVTVPPVDAGDAEGRRAGAPCPPELEDLVKRLQAPQAEDRPAGFVTVLHELESIRSLLAMQTQPPAEAIAGEMPPPPPEPPMMPITVRPPRTTPADPGPSRMWLTGAVGCIAALLGVALFTVFVLLPRWVAERVEPVAPMETTTVEAIPVRDEAGAVMLSLQQADEQWEELRGRSVGRWAGPQSLEVDSLLEQAHDLLDGGATVAASEAVAGVSARIDTLRVEAGRVAAEAATNGRAALAEGRPRAAADLFRYALEVEPGQAEAQEGLERSVALEEALQLIERGAALERSGDLDGAQNAYRRARDRAPWYAEGGAALARVTNGRRDATYAEVVSQALAALDGGRWQDAERALEKADKMKPGAPEVQDGRKRLAAGRLSQRISELEQRAAQQEQGEEWGAAIATYRELLEVAPASMTAQAGLRRAQALDEVDRTLRGHLAHPERLTDRAVRADAESVLADAKAIVSPGSRLEQQVWRLKHLVQQMSTPVAAEIVSDGETEVTIYKVGRLGRFEKQVVQVPPGRYTVVGTRRGFRDVRLTLEVPVGTSPAPLVVRCEESL